MWPSDLDFRVDGGAFADVGEEWVVLASRCCWWGRRGWRGWCWRRACRVISVQRRSSPEWMKLVEEPMGGEPMAQLRSRGGRGETQGSGHWD